MTTQSKPDRKQKTRSPELVAAGAAIALGKIEDTIARAKQTLTDKQAEKEAILDGLDPHARELLDRLRGKGKGA